jgi:hypothetical protein
VQAPHPAGPHLLAPWWQACGQQEGVSPRYERPLPRAQRPDATLLLLLLLLLRGATRGCQLRISGGSMVRGEAVLVQSDVTRLMTAAD